MPPAGYGNANATKPSAPVMLPSTTTSSLGGPVQATTNAAPRGGVVDVALAGMVGAAVYVFM